MTWLATRLTCFAVAFAQVVVAPGVCCLIRAEVFGPEACCHAPAPAGPVTRSCCRKTATEAAPAGHGHSSPPAGECHWCSAEPKVATNDRVALPDLEASLAPVFLSAVEPAPAAPASSELVSDEPFHRTALAACAWLCVWQV